MAKLTEEEQNAIERAIWAIRSNLASEADRYYNNVIFEPDFPGQNHIEQYTALWGREDEEIIAGLWDILIHADTVYMGLVEHILTHGEEEETDEIVAAITRLDDAQA